MFNVEIERTVRLIELRLSKITHELSEQFKNQILFEEPVTVRRMFGIVDSPVQNVIEIAAIGSQFDHSIMFRNDKLQNALFWLNKIRDTNMSDSEISDIGKFHSLDQLCQTCIIDGEYPTRFGSEKLKVTFDKCIENIKNFMSAEYRPISSFERKCSDYKGYGRVEREDLKMVCKQCFPEIRVSGHTTFAEIENFVEDSAKIEAMLINTGKY